MEFYTRIPLPKAPFTFSHTEQTILLGSCFAENIGKMLEENKFKTDLNPFGTLYNPSSIAEAIRMLLRPERFTGDDLLRTAIQFRRHDTESPADGPYFRHGMGLQAEKFGKGRIQLP